MNVSQFFEHWKITENPFRGEEARHDGVFQRLADSSSGLPATALHSDFEKILGQLSRPASAIVFGEKGSGKTAIRLLIAREIARHNERRPDERVMLIAYDDLSGNLDRLHAAVGGDPLAALQTLRLADHLDAILSLATTRLVGEFLDGPRSSDAARSLRKGDGALVRDISLLQAVYDAHEMASTRTARLWSTLRIRPKGPQLAWRMAALLGWIVPALVIAGFFTLGGQQGSDAWSIVFAVAMGLWAIAIAKRLLWDRFRSMRLARRLARQLRMVERQPESWSASLDRLMPEDRSQAILPLTSSEEQRYAMLGRLLRVTRAMGYRGLLVVVDRVDEPTIVNGDAERMRAVIWPMLSNKFLQQDGLGVKMLLPIELRYALFKESSAFFQEARLDKQSLIERLSWTGAMLYDLCNARLAACREPGAEAISLLDLFAEDVTRQDVVDALDQMHQPRDAFKFLYRCLSEHCAGVTADEQSWRIPRLVLEQARRAEVERLQQLYRGIRPA